MTPEEISKHHKDFNRVYFDYREMIYEYALLLTQCSAHAEDIVQDVFITIWKEKGRLDGIQNLRGYLYTITRNRIIDHMRRSQKEQCILRELYYKRGDSGRFTEELIEQKQYKKIVEDVVTFLTPQQKLVFSLGKLYRWKRQQIAEAMGISPATVRVHMNEAIKSIKKQVTTKTKWGQEISEILND